jgi:outer membrane protein OmpA-like peptidoglycan-associated protein
MARGRAGIAVGTVAVAVAGVLAVTGLFFWAHRSTPQAPPQTTTVIRKQDSTTYIAPSGILFDVGSATLSDNAVPVLTTIVADIRRGHLNGSIRVEGYTDDVGSPDYDLFLSREQAETVASWLVDHAQFDRTRIQVMAFGEGSAAKPNDSVASQRVVIAVER